MTPAAACALELARQLARQAGASDLQPVHLLQSLLAEEEGRAADLLNRAGLPVSAVKFDFREVSPPAVESRQTPVPLHLWTQQIVDQAREVAVQYSGERTIATDHLLLALLRHEKTLCQELVNQGLNLAKLELILIAAQAPSLELDEPLRLPEPVELTATARIMDASANRAREALRVVEDYGRFALDDHFLTNEAKQLRHELAEACAALADFGLLGARETLTDVGTELAATGEYERHSLLDVVQANWKRYQEALRSLEEFSKLRSGQLGQVFELLRYRSYTLERAFVLGTTARRRLEDARLYILLTGSACRASLDWTIAEAAAGGAQIIQLREKQLGDRELLERARKVRDWTRQAGVLFIMNDRPDLARLAEADGVHLGQDDYSVKDARRIVGSDALIGVSTHNLEQLRQAIREGASYVGVGPTFASRTKDFEEFAGLEYVRQAAAETSLPSFVIGGVTLETLPAALAAGARRVAISAAIGQADDPRAVAAEMTRQLQAARSA
jgi:thiamine-phosphate pyrophosphorylase